jgi:hypothetical protein
MGAFWNSCVTCGKVIYSGRPAQPTCMDSFRCAHEYGRVLSEHDDPASDHSDYLQRMWDFSRSVLARLLSKLH